MRLHDQGLIDIIGKRPTGKSGTPRIHYQISEEGIICLKEELTRLRHIMKMTEAMRILENETPPDIARILNSF